MTISWCAVVAVRGVLTKQLTGQQANTKQLQLPPDWNEAVEVARRNEKTEDGLEAMMKDKLLKEIVECARRDAKKLSLSEMKDGKTVVY